MRPNKLRRKFGPLKRLQVEFPPAGLLDRQLQPQGRRAGAFRLTLLASAAACLLTPHGVLAQTAPSPPPVVPQVDGNGVDLATGYYNLSVTDAAIGRGTSALTLSRGYNAGWEPGFQNDGVACAGGPGSVPGLPCTGITYTVSLDGSTETFTLSGTNYVSSQGSGNTLTLNNTTNTWTYTRHDGTYATYSAYGFVNNFWATGLSFVRYPNGVTKTNYYTTTSYNITQSSGYTYTVSANRLQGYVTNTGLEIHLNYALNGTVGNGSISLWNQISSVTAINNTIDYCNPSAPTCTGLTQSWPTTSYTYNTNGTLASSTDPLSRTTSYGYDSSSRLTSVTSPAGVVTTITYSGTTSQVASLSNGLGTWTYSYGTSGANVTTTVTDPNSHSRVVTVNPANGLVISDQDALGHTTSFTYDSYGRVTQITSPEGDQVQKTYDGRGNVTQATYVAKPGSGLSNIVTRATFDAACAYPVKCNQPNATFDANNNETDYTYDTTYGSLLTVTLPAGGSGVRPQTRYAYSPTYAYYYVAAGTLGAGPAPVNLLSSTSTCQTLASCAGTSDEVKTTLAYPSSTTPNNLLPISATVAAGSGSPAATTSQTYDMVGNVLTVTGPLGSSQTVRYRYDAARQVVGLVGPSPSEGGLANLAERITHNGDGHVTSGIENITTIGQIQES